MGIISLVAIIDEANGLGLNNHLLCHLPADLQHFKAVTLGKPIIMGRKTYESIGKALPGRLNIVLSSSSFINEGVIVVNTFESALTQVKDQPEIMIIGGATLYEQAYEMAQRLYITRIHHHFMADVFFPEIDELKWNCTSKVFREQDEQNKFDLTFHTYERK
jgi:dihydrofolate reductase